MTDIRKTGTILLLAAYVFTAAFGELGHTDILPIIDHSGHRLSSHAAHNAQIDLDAAHCCQACYRTANFAGYEPPLLLVSKAVRIAIVVYPQPLSLKLSESLNFLPKRGPPAVFPQSQLI